MRKSKFIAILVAIMMCLTCIGGIPFALAEETLVIDPTFMVISPSGTGDLAKINADGTVTLELTPTAGFGCRALSSVLGEVSLLNVKDFTTTIGFTDIPINITTIFSLQTVATGTIGAGNGNGINILLRRDAADKVAVAIYNQAASEPAYWAPGHMTLDSSLEIKITYNYESETPIVIESGKNQFAAPTQVVSKKAFDDHYKESGYKAYYGLSSYYMAMPQKTEIRYDIKSINHEVPTNTYFQIVNTSVTKLVEAAATLSDQSTEQQINAVNAINLFTKDSPATKLLTIVDRQGVLAAQLAPALGSLEKYNQKATYELIKGQIDAFGAALNRYSDTDAASMTAAIEAYEAIDRETIATLSADYKNSLQTSLDALTKGNKFKNLIRVRTDQFIRSFENKINGDVSSYKTYDSIHSIVATWSLYKEKNYINTVLDATEIAAFDARIVAIGGSVKDSFYSTLWREGDTWDAQLFKKGLYMTGKGEYNQTMGFKQKLEVGKNASIDFNIIYALKKLGANHLHIGFYPVVNTGTRGEYDGVRVDFWFSALDVIEVKPVNGKTEADIFDTAYISVPDGGFFDIDAATPNYDEGKYKVTLSKEGNALLLMINGMEMSLKGLDASLFTDGCYLTISTMSAENVEPNELLVTKVGDISYIDYKKPTDPVNPEKPKKPGCGSIDVGGGMFGGMGLLALSMVFVVWVRKYTAIKNKIDS